MTRKQFLKTSLKNVSKTFNLPNIYTVKMNSAVMKDEGRSETGNGPGIDLVAGGRSKALEADRQTSMTHYI